MRTALAIALGCLALALPACGGDDETTPATTTATGASGASGTTEQQGQVDSGGGSGPKPDDAGGSDEQLATKAVEAVVGGGDPDVACAEAVTQGYVNSAYGDEAGCRAAIEGQGSFDVEVEDLVIDGEEAEATAVPASGPNENEDVNVRLVYEEGAWKVDFVRSDAPAGP